MSKAKIIAEQLSQGQKDFLAYFYKTASGKCYRSGTPRGLVSRQLLGYAWGCDASMGYKATELGKQVALELETGK